MEYIKEDGSDLYKKSRALFIITAALQHFISTFIASTYIAKLAMSVGIDDATIGMLTTGIELGNLFQIFALFLSKLKTRKQMIIICTATSQLLFATLYFLPITKIETGVLSALFIIMLFSGAFLYGMITPLKSAWTASTLDNKKRGAYYSLCEAISLISGIFISLGASAVIDSFEAAGNLKAAFITIGITMIVICVTQAILLLFAKEPSIDYGNENLAKKLKNALSDKNLILLIPFFVIVSMAYNTAIPFYSTYALGELGFNMTFMTLLTTVYSLIRAALSVPIGKFADKHSFVSSMTLSLVMLIIAVEINIFTNPSNAFILFPIYYVFFAVAAAGYFTSQANLVLDYTKLANRTESLAVYTTVYGISSLATTNLMRILITHVQNTGSFLFFKDIYPQQALSAISVVLFIVALVYLRLVVGKMKKDSCIE